MLSRDELARSGPPDFTLGQKEKDYTQHWILTYMSRSGFAGVFKGGTALQKAYGLPRYSEDLDFTLGDERLPDWEALERYLAEAGFTNPQHKQEENDVSHRVRLKAGAPLYNGTLVSLCSVVMEFSLREKALEEPSLVEITPPYPGLMPYTLPVMEKGEIAAEKVRAILTRTSARDLYDLSFLLQSGAALRPVQVAEKLQYYGVSFDYQQFEKRIRRLEKEYRREIGALTSQVQEYKTVRESVLRGVKKEMGEET